MSDKASALSTAKSHPRGLAMAALAFLAVAAVLAAAAAAPYVFKGATLEGEVAAQLRATMGLSVATSDHARFVLLPAPHIEMTGLRIVGVDGALAIDAAALEGDVRLLPLIVGRLELESATLMRPKLTVDLDTGAMPDGSTIGRALHGLAPASNDPNARLGTVTLVDGTAVVKSRLMGRPPLLEGIDVTIDWPDVASPATLTGSLMVDGSATDIAAWVAQPSSLMRGETSPIALRVHAEPLDLSANGDLVSTQAAVFHGHMSLTAPSLPALFARAGARVPHLAPFADAALTSDTTVTIDRAGATNFDLPGLSLDLDGNHYEGTLAYASGSRPSLSGTLATETLTLAPFLAEEPSLSDRDHRWTRTALAAGGADAVDLDLRISAAHLKVAPFTIDDAALSVMTRGARTEIALNEGTAYGGALKARASIGDQTGTLSLRVSGTLADADLVGLGWDAFGRQLAAGTLTGALNVETSGDTAAALMAHLQGWAKMRASDGEVSGLDLGRGLREIGAKDAGANDAGAKTASPSLAALRRGRTPFSSAELSLRLADGVATIETASLHGPDAVAVLTGTADIAGRRLDLDATATPSETSRKDRGRLAVAIKGDFDAPLFIPVAPPAPLKEMFSPSGK